MTINQIEMVMNSLSDIAIAGKRQQKRVRDILKLMKLSIDEHDYMMSIPEYVQNYIVFLGEDGLKTAQITRDNFDNGLKTFIESGIITQEEVDNLNNKDI